MTYAKLKASGLEPRAAGRPFSLQRLLVPSPEVGDRWALVLLAFLVTAVVAVWLGATWWDRLDTTYGDTDDATRLVAVRALLDGRGWYDQLVTRVQPPQGLWMHWSRLLDGAIAGLDRLFRLGLPANDAEFWTRFTWPLLWIFPSVLASLCTARGLGRGLLNNAAVLVCAVILASDIELYVQYHPGRIDHHDVQMTLAFVALAAAIRPGRNVGGGLVAGLASALGTAVGLEALVFSAAVGGGLALRFGFDRRQAAAAQAYGLALALGTAAAFVAQTPPARLGVEACDALALNLTAALLVAGLGLAALARFAARLGWRLRLGLLAGLGVATGATYLALYPNCIHGFFADVDPRIRPIWLNYVQEVKPIRQVLKHNLADGVERITPWALGLVAWLMLGLSAERRRSFGYWMSGLLLALAVAAAASAIRMTGYAEWFAAPIVAAAAVEVLGWRGYRNWLAVLLAAAVATPITAQGVATQATNAVAPLFAKKKPGAAKPKAPARRAEADRCFDMDGFDTLADQPARLVLSEVDLGPHVLANTDMSVVAGPYHRMAPGILKAHALLKAPADGGAAGLVRQAGVAYVLECRGHASHGDRADMPRSALQKRLDAGAPPNWLQLISPRGEPLQTYRVLPPGQGVAPVSLAAPAPVKLPPSPPARGGAGGAR